MGNNPTYFDFGSRKIEPEDRAALRRTRQPDAPAVRLDQRLDDRQPEPGRARADRAGHAPPAVEPLPDPAALLRSDAGPPVGDLDPHPFRPLEAAHRDGPVRRVAQRV